MTEFEEYALADIKLVQELPKKLAERELATIRRIAEIAPIPNADAIEAARIDGWWVVIKKAEFKVDELVVYLEVDSWVPTSVAPFLTKPGHTPKEFEGVQGERLRTIKLRGQLSQGLILPLKGFDAYFDGAAEVLFDEGTDVTGLLGIKKYEKPIAAHLAGLAKGNFPSFIPKTDEQRIQNLGRQFAEWHAAQEEFEVTEKLDGSSMTVYARHGMDDEAGPTVSTGVCSRNLELKPDENNTFWAVAIKEEWIEKLIETGYNYALQGELVGPGIQGNPYGLSESQFFCYKIWDIDEKKFLPPKVRRWFCNLWDIRHVPVISDGYSLDCVSDVATLLKFAEGPSMLNPKAQREGYVFKSDRNPDASFKVISNAWLLKNE